MKKIRVTISKIKNHFYAKIPDIVASNLNLSNSDNIEISIHSNKNDDQIEIWDIHPEDINSITFKIKEEVHTMNMYNRIYIPEKYRFFLPSKEKDFLLITNVGTIKTHITSNGYFTKGLRQWFYVNGPLMPKDEISINLIREKNYQYELQYKKNNENNNRTI
tara:strand:+ start:315 stop:800 length:486 start_codon:yes stop_codon:yes gene_type:complete